MAETCLPSGAECRNLCYAGLVNAPVATDALALVEASPEAVARHDKEAWLALFTPDAVIEDPVGAGAHIGADRLSRFWDVFIAPHEVTFVPRRDFVQSERVIRHVRIETLTGVAEEPLAVPAIIEYRLRDDRIARLRAFWEPTHAVAWYARRGARGLGGLLRHSGRMTKGLGLKSSLGFGRALVERLSLDRGRDLATRIADALSDRDRWLALVGRARVDVHGVTDPAGSWDRFLGLKGELEEVIVAGDHVAFVCADRARAAAVIARVSGNELEAVTAMVC